MSVVKKICGWGKPTIQVDGKTYEDAVINTATLSVEEQSVIELQIEGGEVEDSHKDTDRYLIDFDRRVGSVDDVELGYTDNVGDISVMPPHAGAIGVTLLNVSRNVTLKSDTTDGLVVHHQYKTHGEHDSDGNPTDVVPQVKSASTYSEVTSTTGKNPKAEGWYIKNGSVYILSQDTEAQSGMTYYTLD